MRSKQFFADCRSLVELEISHSDWDLIVPFISLNRNLKSLIVNQDVPSSTLQLLANYKQLETLGFCAPHTVTVDLSNHGHLRKLLIECRGRNFPEAALGLENLQFLEELQLFGREVDSEFVRTLSQLKRLRVLEFFRCTELHSFERISMLSQLTMLTTLTIDSEERADLDIALLVQRLSKLNCLTLEAHEFTFDLELYLRMVDVVRRSPDRSKLTFRLRSYGTNYNNLLPHFARNAHLVEMI